MVERHLREIRRDLQRARHPLQPHVWLSEEWFSPDGVPGIAVPFYMAHPRLMRLERRFMDEVEGGNANWLTRILRHEIGHALDNAYRLRRRKGWRQARSARRRARIPDIYRPRPASRDFVLHLGHWYAQSHPTEDFAETFAVWMQPSARWRREYQGWPALRKLEYVDELMDAIRGERPVGRQSRADRAAQREPRARSASTIDASAPATSSTRPTPTICGSSACSASSARADGACAASTFLRQCRPQLERLLMRRSRLYPYLVHHVLRTVIHRCRELDLVLDTSKREAKRAVLGVLERILIDILRRDRERYTL